MSDSCAPKRVTLVTGAGGMTGRYLSASLARYWAGARVGLDRAGVADAGWSEFLSCDLTDRAAVERVVAGVQPDVVFHLAGVFGGAEPDEIRRVNVGGYLHLADALRSLARHKGRKVRLIVVGSAAELGHVGASRLPVREDAPCEPESDYGRSKHEVTRRALAEPAHGPLEIIVARTFNLLGPGLSEHLALGRFARQIAAVVRGRAETIRCGPLDTRRDFLDVRDAVEAYRLLGERGEPGQLYQVCSGQSHRIGDLLEMMLAHAGIAPPIISEATARPGDLADVYGDPSKLIRATGWKAEIPLERSMAEMVDFAQL
jgi:GDP-4-dehydro-6-deoxy-D-mannose reductase